MGKGMPSVMIGVRPPASDHPSVGMSREIVVSRDEFAVPTAPSTRPTSHLVDTRPSTIPGLAKRPSSPQNAKASSSKRRLDTEHAPSKSSNFKKVERRVLPARIASSNINSASNSTSASRDLDDMVMECFAKAFLETYQASETIPVIITTEPVSTLRDSLLPSLEEEPPWWNGQFSSFRRSAEIKQKRASHAAPPRPSETKPLSPSPGKHRASLGNRQKPSAEPLIDSFSPASNSSRGLRARALVLYTDSAVIKPEPMDTSDESYAQLHRKHEMAEKKDKLRETDKMVHARNKLKGRIEVLEAVDEQVWLAHIEKLLKKAARYARDGQEQMSPSEESSDDDGMDQMKGKMTEDELAEKVQRLVLLAGMELVRRKSVAQLKEELIVEGKDLLEKYNKTLRIRSGKSAVRSDQGNKTVYSDAEDPGKSRNRHISNEVEMSETPEVEFQKPEYQRYKRKRIEVSHDSDNGSRSPSLDLEPLPVDAAARSDGESVYEEAHEERPKKKQSERKAPARRIAHTLSIPSTGLPAVPVLPEREPFYAPLTASGLPVLVEAAEKRLSIMEDDAERKRLEEQAKAKGIKVSERRSKSSRALAAPFGMHMPDMIGFHSDYDLDGDFWIPLLRARLEGGFTLESVRAQNGIDGAQALMPDQIPVLPPPPDIERMTTETSPSSDLQLTDAVLPKSELQEAATAEPVPVLPPPPALLQTQPDNQESHDRRRNQDTLNDNENHFSDVVPDSQPADSDVVPSSCRTEEPVASSWG